MRRYRDTALRLNRSSVVLSPCGPILTFAPLCCERLSDVRLSNATDLCVPLAQLLTTMGRKMTYIHLAGVAVVGSKAKNPIDAHVGLRIRAARLAAGLSQERLANALGVTFQQVQKYEKGVNRVGAGRLSDSARILSVPVSFFFED